MDAKSTISKATGFIKSRDFDQAIPLLKDLVDIDSKNELALGMLASVYAEIGMKEKAISYYEQILSLNPSNPLARFQLGLIHFNSQKLSEALNIWQPSLNDKNDFMAHYFCGLAYRQQQLTDKARSLFVQAEKNMPNNHPLYSSLRDILTELGGLH